MIQNKIILYYRLERGNISEITAIRSKLSDHQIIQLRVHADEAWMLGVNNRKLPVSIDYNTGELTQRKRELRGYQIHWFSKQNDAQKI